mmetsp:Transcript_99784/g.286628  ORF Transcript_99784/g.286628 Transcript_99784/m.286628 type:complete len:249 (+) Transcript_99784:1687-2433(+)
MVARAGLGAASAADGLAETSGCSAGDLSRLELAADGSLRLRPVWQNRGLLAGGLADPRLVLHDLVDPAVRRGGRCGCATLDALVATAGLFRKFRCRSLGAGCAHRRRGLGACVLLEPKHRLARKTRAFGVRLPRLDLAAGDERARQKARLGRHAACKETLRRGDDEHRHGVGRLPRRPLRRGCLGCQNVGQPGRRRGRAVMPLPRARPLCASRSRSRAPAAVLYGFSVHVEVRAIDAPTDASATTLKT